MILLLEFLVGQSLDVCIYSSEEIFTELVKTVYKHLGILFLSGYISENLIRFGASTYSFLSATLQCTIILETDQGKKKISNPAS